MATISLNDSAPKGSVHISLGEVDFDLKSGGSYDSDDPSVISSAEQHPWLDVKFPEVKKEDVAGPDLSDPQHNPTLDHLSAYASKETLEKAAANRERIFEATHPEVQNYAEEEAKPEPSPVVPAPSTPEVTV